MSFSFTYPTPLPSTKGWGPGWPNCDNDTRVPHPIFQGGVHREIKELVDLLVAEIQRRGYVFKPGWSWGGGCRATKGGGGDVPSFHSWWLGLDFNAPENVFGAAESTSDIAMHNRWIVALMREYGFFWLGPPIKDWMHFSFVGSPADAREMTVKARRELGEDDMTDAEKAQLAEALETAKAIERGIEDFNEETPPPDAASRTRKRTYRALLVASRKPAPVPGPKGDPGPQGPKGDTAELPAGSKLRVEA